MNTDKSQAKAVERGLQPASMPELRTTLKRPEGRAPQGAIRVYPCASVVSFMFLETKTPRTVQCEALGVHELFVNATS